MMASLDLSVNARFNLRQWSKGLCKCGQRFNNKKYLCVCVRVCACACLCVCVFVRVRVRARARACVQCG